MDNLVSNKSSLCCHHLCQQQTTCCWSTAPPESMSCRSFCWRSHMTPDSSPWWLWKEERKKVSICCLKTNGSLHVYWYFYCRKETSKHGTCKAATNVYYLIIHSSADYFSWFSRAKMPYFVWPTKMLHVNTFWKLASCVLWLICRTVSCGWSFLYWERESWDVWAPQCDKYRPPARYTLISMTMTH